MLLVFDVPRTERRYDGDHPQENGGAKQTASADDERIPIWNVARGRKRSLSAFSTPCTTAATAPNFSSQISDLTTSNWRGRS